MTDVYIDVGHSAASAGAVGYDGRTEHAEGLELAHMLAPRLRAAGISYQMDLSGNDPGYRGSTDRANASGAKVVIELHRDWRGSAADESCFGLYATSAGERVAREITKALGARGLPIWKDGTVDEDEIGRHGLGFLNNTKSPAVILELGKIKNYPEARNRVEADGITAGLAAIFEKEVPKPPGVLKEHRDVAVGAVRRPDTELAAALGWAHGFAYVQPLPDGRWLQTYPDGREVIIDSVGYLAGIGYQADQLIDDVGDGVTISGSTARTTAIEVAKLIRLDKVDRLRPFR